ncbi:adenosylcobinamide-GDP ribazoletransferase [Gellertiella hungarica]|uniref:Adenosylcobinamide-GDP ribazoletransferase n=1 Tax=Gellertiella hungarica TaxID=1572859 RepID=A0A7W6NKL8_9HYPH|nr:adenosylcobinamide-GDP ribazoletransferase [Gellertiella hungarica]MBB4064540.1 adenosylcobinamide-GDP ribazoletransferase [Gellertiella hungarica]
MPLGELITSIARSTGFLSRLPVPGHHFEGDDGRMEKTPEGFALSGVVISALPALVLYLAGHAEAPLLAAAIAVGLLVLLTGALHEDGLGDTADGLGGGRNRERALEIMKDSRIGTYGALALGLSLLVRVSALSALITEASPAAAALALAGSAALSRSAMVWHWRHLPPAKADGVAARVGVPTGAALRMAVGTGLAAFLLLTLPVLSLPAVAVTVLAGFGATFLFTIHIGRRLAGHTGDTIGATQQISDMVLLATLALLA